MELPPKALHALVDIKKELLSAESSDRFPEETPRRENPSQKEGRVSVRHARGSNAFQRGCQRHSFWSPVH
jgi:hypothetical protein